MAFEKIVPQLMGDAEILEAFALYMRGVENPEHVAVPQQHARHAARRVRHRLDLDVPAPAIAMGSTGKVVIPSSRRNASAFCLAILRRNA